MTPGDTVTLLDKDGASVGVFFVKESKPQAVFGIFLPGSDYERFRGIFEEFASRVNSMSLAYLDEIEHKITAFGIHGVVDGRVIQVFDLQIFGENASLRLSPFVPMQ